MSEDGQGEVVKKRGPGRPPKYGTAMSAQQRAAAYRERQALLRDRAQKALDAIKAAQASGYEREACIKALAVAELFLVNGLAGERWLDTNL